MNEYDIKLEINRIMNGGPNSGNHNPGQGRGIGKPSNGSVAAKLKDSVKKVSEKIESRLDKSIKKKEEYNPYQKSYYDQLRDAHELIRSFKYYEKNSDDKNYEESINFQNKKFKAFKDSVEVKESILNAYRTKDRLNDFLVNKAYKLSEKEAEYKQQSLENELYSQVKDAKNKVEKYNNKHKFSYSVNYDFETMNDVIKDFMNDVNDLEIG